MADRKHSLERIYNDNAARRGYLWGRLRVEDWPDDLRRAQEMLLLVSEMIWQRTKLDAPYQATAPPEPDEERDAILRELADIANQEEQLGGRANHAQVLVPIALLRRARALVLAGKERG